MPGFRRAGPAALLLFRRRARRQSLAVRVSASGRVPLLSVPAHALGARIGVAEKHRYSQRGILDPLELAPTRAGRFRFHRPHQPAARSARLNPNPAAVGPQRLGAQCRAGRWMAESGGSGCRRRRHHARLVEAAQRHFGDADRQPRRSGGLGGRHRTRDRRRRPARRRAHLRRRSDRARAQPPGLRHRQERAVDRRGRSALPGRLEKRQRSDAGGGRGRVEWR